MKEEEEKEKNQMREHDDEIVRIHTTHDDGCWLTVDERWPMSLSKSQKSDG